MDYRQRITDYRQRITEGDRNAKGGVLHGPGRRRKFIALAGFVSVLGVLGALGMTSAGSPTASAYNVREPAWSLSEVQGDSVLHCNQKVKFDLNRDDCTTPWKYWWSAAGSYREYWRTQLPPLAGDAGYSVQLMCRLPPNDGTAIRDGYVVRFRDPGYAGDWIVAKRFVRTYQNGAPLPWGTINDAGMPLCQD